jgi:hypothetical protein
MFKNRFFRKLLHPRVEDIDQVKLVYILSLVVGLLSALAAAILKNKFLKLSYYEKRYFDF